MVKDSGVVMPTNAITCACGEQLDSGQDAQAGAQVHPVTGDIGEVRFLDDGLCAGHAVVELVVARVAMS